ncbi:MAG: hypothetical protein ABJG14_22395 [Sulfitobacter sp.]|uniref:hypothetical protein n=1 Tax=Alphaproteobacteria TaxID=28211 RepID=UPI003265BFA0
MHDTDVHFNRHARPLALGKVESELKAASPQLNLHLVGQAHYGATDFAFIEVHGIEDQSIRRQIRKKASERLEELGFSVNLHESKDVYHIVAFRPD